LMARPLVARVEKITPSEWGMFACLKNQLESPPYGQTLPPNCWRYGPSCAEKSVQYWTAQQRVNRYSNKPNGVIIAHFGMSSAATTNQFFFNRATMQTVWKVLHVWQQVLVRSYQIKSVIITTGPPRPIFFRHHVQRGCPWWCWMRYRTCCLTRVFQIRKF
jgi:hypothetical protein